MDFDNAKENIQPLASGRNVSLLQASLSQDSAHGQELLAHRKQMEEEVRTYVGEDPLEPWYKYICWIEQSYPAGGSGSGLHAALHQCLTKFEEDERYRQDKRLIRLFIKFMEKQKDQIEFYQQMYNNGIGTMLADFYIAWAYSYDLSGNMRKADEIFRLGLDCRAEPLEELREAHQHFGYTVGQRLLYTTGEEANAVNQELNERRLALQSLHGRRQRSTNVITVGSVRTGAAVKSGLPGVVQTDASSTSGVRNAGRNVQVFNDENAEANIPLPVSETEGKSSLRSIIDAARGQENVKEPVAWNTAHAKRHKHGKIFGNNTTADLGFDIHVDDHAHPPITNYERRLDQPFRFPPNFVVKNKPQQAWVTPVTIEDEPNANGLPCYNKCLLYPRPNLEFSPEEYRAFVHLKRHDPHRPFVQRNDEWWGTGGVVRGVRCYPNFAKSSKPQPRDELDKFWKPPLVQGLQVVFDKIYNDEEQQEYQSEELLAAKWLEKRNVTVHGDFDMEETVCLPGNKMPRRKSFFPSSSRKSMMQRRVSSVQEEYEKEEEEAAVVEEEAASQPLAKPQTSVSAQLPVVSEQKVMQQIEIFKDSVASSDDHFAVPAPPVRKIEIFEDSEDSQPTPKTKPSSAGPFFDGDETCSTQMFNMFIKSQAVSTPKGTQKQAPSRQFGTVLRELPPAEEPAPVPAVESTPCSPMLRKQLSTILETSEHGTQSLATSCATTKSTITSSSSPGSHTVFKVISKNEESTPGQMRLQRMVGLSAVVAETENHGGDNFSRRELWEPNAPSLPMLKSLRFQEDKTETIPRPLACFQEDKTETMPRMPTLLLEDSLSHGSVVNDKPSPLPKLSISEDENDLCGLFGKTPPKITIFGSPKRICERTTPDLFTSMKCTQDAMNSFALDTRKPGTALSTSKLEDSIMTDLSFVPETQLGTVPKPKPEVMQKKFEIFLDDSQPEVAASKTVASVASSFALDYTLPETQPPVQSAGKQETDGQSHMIASFMKDCIEISRCPSQTPPPIVATNLTSTATVPKFSRDSMSGNPANDKSSCGKQADQFFELNAVTEMFATNISMIKNSTLLQPPAELILPLEEAESAELSIYYKTTPVTPKQSHHSWSQSDFKTPSREQFVHPKNSVDQSVLNETLADPNKNPFNVDLIRSLLESIDFSLYIEKLPHCHLVGHVKRLHPNSQLEVHNEKFEVGKMIGKGAYGSVYVGQHIKSGKKVALKQERPTNYWEFYICLEVHSRLTSEQMIPAYQHIDYALVGNNSSVYISEFSDYGSLIGVCNKIKSVTNRNLDEYVVMHLSCQMLDIVDHLHAMGIIHADIKPDNFLLMRPLCADPNELSLQLIDFGVSIDTKLFPNNQTFNYVHHDDLFKCIEMRTQRPWTYQLDLYGLVSVMHVLLFGRYMEVAPRTGSTVWMPKTTVPRYFQRQMWENIFRTLLNVRDCRTMPNLQQLRTQLKYELAEKEKYVGEAISKFNTILQP
ncbi:uncharacterized protein LOC108048440 [Drosophila rhopaloa]|uniref:Mitotic checkpoint serine/threonine-protein kinase BUB1 n=1 Tax=Drosophila rhopaloa TaxID=1041015 RepID=A0ABM5HS28_DRORH|nr:uncharacterized protein LOC108048440 [Drosophila rhopaloa]